MTRLNSIPLIFQPMFASEASVAQLQGDAFSSRFFAGATDLRGLAGMSLGSFVYQSTKLILSTPTCLPWMRLFSPLIALSAEVSAVRASHSFLYEYESVSRDSWWTTWTHFACLKGISPLLGRQNPILRNAGQTIALVAGAELCGQLGLAEKTNGSLEERLVFAAVENIQMQMGARFVTLATGHHLHHLEKSFSQSQELNSLASSIRRQSLDARTSRLLQTMHSYGPSDESVFYRPVSWKQRLPYLKWDILDAHALQELSLEYSNFDIVEKNALFSSVHKQIHLPQARAAIGKFLEQQNIELQLEFVRNLCHLTALSESSLSRALDFSELHPQLSSSARALMAYEFRTLHADVENREAFRNSFEAKILNRWVELIPSVPVVTINADRNRGSHIARLIRMTRRPDQAGLRATLSLGKMIKAGGWQRDFPLIKAFFDYADSSNNILELQNAFEIYVNTGRVLFTSLESAVQQKVLEELWDSHSPSRWQARSVFDRMVRSLPERDLQLTYYRRYYDLLEANEDEAVLFAINKIDASAFPMMELSDRADLMVRISRRLADKNADVVDAACDLFDHRLSSLGTHGERVVDAVGKVVSQTSQGALGLEHIQALSAAVPERLRRKFVIQVLPAVQRILLRG